MKQTLSIRKTRKYVGTYQHMDDWQDIGYSKVIAKGKVKRNDDPEDACDSTSQVLLVKVKIDEGLEVSRNDIRQALDASFTQAGCHHEWDCCGCRSYYGTAKHLKKNLWKVAQTSSRNY